jgi:DNA-binding NarL/FixJ family response regulator
MAKTRKVLVLTGAGSEQGVRETVSRQTANTSLRVVTSDEEFRAALADFSPDVVVIDEAANVPVKPAIAAVKQARPGAASIVVMNEINETLAGSYLRNGAEAFVLRGNLGRISDMIDEAAIVRVRLDQLTIRQLDVLRRIAEGQKTHEIARDLDLSVKTVETHRSEIKKRLRIHEFAGLVRYAVRVGLVSINGAQLEATPAHVD